MHYAAHDVVVAQGQQVPALSRPRVPAAQADGPLVRQQNIVLSVVEHSLCPVHLPSTQTCACHTNQHVSLGMKRQPQTPQCSRAVPTLSPPGPPPKACLSLWCTCWQNSNLSPTVVRPTVLGSSAFSNDSLAAGHTPCSR